jgi:DNA-binding XRE family transcriptional regulator
MVTSLMKMAQIRAPVPVTYSVRKVSDKVHPMSSETIRIVSVRQVKAARMLLGWSQDDLAEASKVGLGTLKRIEAGKGDEGLGGRPATAAAIISALVAAGVSFDLSDGSGVGVRLRG